MTGQQTQDAELSPAQMHDRGQQEAAQREDRSLRGPQSQASHTAQLEEVRRRFQRQLAEQRGVERARVAAQWLPVLDNLERALGHAGGDPQAIVDGVVSVWEQARAILARLGFTPIEDAGGVFDPQRHEAVQVVPHPDAKPGTVIEVLRPGYASGAVMLRPAAVVVAGDPDSGEPAPGEPA